MELDLFHELAVPPHTGRQRAERQVYAEMLDELALFDWRPSVQASMARRTKCRPETYFGRSTCRAR